MTTTSSDSRTPPNVEALLRELVRGEVDFIVAGSVAIQAWGADVGTPGDLDIVPDLNHRNLSRLAGVLDRIDAHAWPATGRWETGATDQSPQWSEYAADDPRRGQPLSAPDPTDATTFDSLFSTRHGELDIVPHLCGSFEWLDRRAVPLTVQGLKNLRVTHIDDLLGLITVPRRTKDIPRVADLRTRQRQLAAL